MLLENGWEHLYEYNYKDDDSKNNNVIKLRNSDGL